MEQVCGGPTSPLGQAVLAGEGLFALWSLARYVGHNDVQARLRDARCARRRDAGTDGACHLLLVPRRNSK